MVEEGDLRREKKWEGKGGCAEQGEEEGWVFSESRHQHAFTPSAVGLERERGEERSEQR